LSYFREGKPYYKQNNKQVNKIPTTSKARQLRRKQAHDEKIRRIHRDSHQQQMGDKQKKTKMTTTLKRIKSIFKERKNQQPKKR
jgi:hypothetical protein